MTRLASLQSRWTGCTRCGLHTMRSGPAICFGGGHPKATYLIVGNAPRDTDERTGAVFSGPTAAVLLRALDDAKIDKQDCYFTYAVACRPKVFIPATDTEDERIEDRAPSRDELIACRNRLYETLYQVDPRVVITVGEWATKTMVRGRMPRFVEAVGKQYVCVLPAADPEDHTDGNVEGKARYHDIRYPVFAVPDPAAVLMNTSGAAHGPHHVLQKTLQRARELVAFVRNSENKTMEQS